MNALVIIGGLAALALAGWIGWISVQSLRQALALNVRPTGSLARMCGRAVALRGRVRVSDPIRTGNGEPCLWRRQIVEERDMSFFGSRHRRSWHTVSDQNQTAGFVLDVGGQPVEVGEPTELQGTASSRDYGEGGWLMGATSRATEEWMPLVEELTVLGKLEERRGGLHVVKDATLGLLWSPRPPGQAATWETVKAVAGFVAIAAIVVGAVWLHQTHGRGLAQERTQNAEPSQRTARMASAMKRVRSVSALADGRDPARSVTSGFSDWVPGSPGIRCRGT